MTDKETVFLRFLAARPGSIVSRAQLNEEVWGYHPQSTSRAIDKTLARLRAKIEIDTAHPRFLLTVRGEGWRLVLPEPSAPPIPVPRGVIFGRQTHCDLIACWLQEGSRWVTIVGIGGLGKTQLVLSIARSASAHARVRWVELTDVCTLIGLRSAIAAVLGLKSSDSTALRARSEHHVGHPALSSHRQGTARRCRVLWPKTCDGIDRCATLAQ